ncbi:FtsK/SpoIIIE family DNA translocase [Calderihabitans maritimus]|uniref:DNA segregation ATPase FtsK/SpoIIIE and related proteins n=1 Tax=Calderihabitans maritimus TaxID=1246530 RepID=A0A1Z5HQA0_9FIRM|nr:DNA translocase FtsK [Calderihabitans maritimus]GAW91547.1 DNA segregation ATPase FtsK/SpoIIIE and related proteins [Calderihabitans maritimus]
MGGIFNQIKEELKKEIVGIILVALALLSAVSIYIVDSGLWIEKGQAVGSIGRFLVRFLSTMAGQGRYLLPLLLAGYGVWLMRRNQHFPLSPRAYGTLFLYLIILAAMHLPIIVEKQAGQALRLALDGYGGGVLGALVAVVFYTFFGIAGTYIILGALMLISILMITELSLTALLRKGFERLKSFCYRLRGEISNFIFTVVEEEEELPPVPAKSRKKKGQKKARNEKEVQEKKSFTTTPQEKEPASRERQSGPRVRIYPEPLIPQPEATPAPKEEQKELSSIAAEAVSEESETGELKDKAVGKKYQLPSVSLLQRSARPKSSRLHKEINERVRRLEETLESFKVKAKVNQVSCGPAITRFEIQPAPGVKVSRIVSLADDIALSLAAPTVRIEAPIPGKAAVGIEVPNHEISLVHFREVVDTPEFYQASSKLTMALGKDIAGNPVIADLAKMPHLLIAGATGSGKSVCLNSLICSLLFKCTPAELKLLMIDPKMVELTTYNGIPHLISPVVTDAQKAAAALRWAVNEMEKRYELFAEASVKDIVRYNKLKAEEAPGQEGQELPYVVVLIDELADLMMVSPVEVEDAICRLAQMARAAGIHLVVATQRPSVDVITGLIKANIPSRIAFAVSSQTDSRTILDMGGAEKLLGSGDMLFFPVGAAKPIRVQGAYVSDKEVEEIVAFWKRQGQPEFQEIVVRSSGPSQETEKEEEDELFPQAVKIIVEHGQASISLLQRRLRIGYTRAARLIDMMEERGIVGAFEGSKPRAVLITEEEYEEMFGN